MPPMLILWIDATNSIVYEWVKIAINEQRAKGREHRAESIGQIMLNRRYCPARESGGR